MAGSWHGRPNGPVETPNPLLGERTFWTEQDPDGAGGLLREAALEIITMALRDVRERERRLAAIGRTLLLPAEERVPLARAQTYLAVLAVLRDVYDQHAWE